MTQTSDKQCLTCHHSHGILTNFNNTLLFKVFKFAAPILAIFYPKGMSILHRVPSQKFNQIVLCLTQVILFTTIFLDQNIK